MSRYILTIHFLSSVPPLPLVFFISSCLSHFIISIITSYLLFVFLNIFFTISHALFRYFLSFPYAHYIFYISFLFLSYFLLFFLSLLFTLFKYVLPFRSLPSSPQKNVYALAGKEALTLILLYKIYIFSPEITALNLDDKSMNRYKWTSQERILMPLSGVE